MRRSNTILKKTLIFALAVLSVVLCSCHKNVTVNPSSETGTSLSVPSRATRPPQPKATNTEQIDNETVYKANGLTVKAEALDFDDPDTDKIKVKFRITNESQYDLKVSIPKDSDGKNTILINGKKVQATLAKTLQKPDTVVWLEIYWHQLRSEYNIETIDSIELKLIFTEPFVKNAEPLFMTDTIRLTTKKA